MFKVQDIHKTAGFKVHTLTNGSFKENCYVVEQLKTLEISIVDPGSQFEAIRDYLYQLNLSPTQILLTHGHFDHIGVIDELVVCFKCPCYVNSAEKKLIRQAGIYAYRFDRMRLLPPTFLT
ncbi:MAG: MBL fold metallo-hydrolase, partial [Patescibacteria group bacterium]|nr:MBL fold metallo-hydrolase [Patescibacteria group bacterium]